MEGDDMDENAKDYLYLYFSYPLFLRFLLFASFFLFNMFDWLCLYLAMYILYLFLALSFTIKDHTCPPPFIHAHLLFTIIINMIYKSPSLLFWRRPVRSFHFSNVR